VVTKLNDISPLLTRFIGHDYRYVEATGSTNDDMRRLLAQESLPDGAVLLTNHQTAGKGRLRRQWVAAPDSSLLFSLLLRPDWEAERAGWMTMLASTAVSEAIATVTKLTVGLKWPNDVMLLHEGEWRKVGGLLLEGGTANGRLQHTIIGIGINVNMTADELPAAVTPPISLSLVGKRPFSRKLLLTTILTKLEAAYDAAYAGQSPRLAWQAQLITLGQPVTATFPDGKIINGTAESTDEYGRLLLRDATGKLRPIAAADVTLRRKP
jgi:BirA family biotin operon repressor/biotin-[acetyl-CoA-carboxylase] ligase